MTMITAETLNMSNQEFNELVQKELLELFKQNKYTILDFTEINNDYEPFKWFNSRTVLINLRVLVHRNQIKDMSETHCGLTYLRYKYLSSRQTKKINAKQEAQEKRNQEYVINNKKMG